MSGECGDHDAEQDVEDEEGEVELPGGEVDVDCDFHLCVGMRIGSLGGRWSGWRLYNGARL